MIIILIIMQINHLLHNNYKRSSVILWMLNILSFDRIESVCLLWCQAHYFCNGAINQSTMHTNQSTMHTNQSTVHANEPTMHINRLNLFEKISNKLCLFSPRKNILSSAFYHSSCSHWIPLKKHQRISWIFELNEPKPAIKLDLWTRTFWIS